MRIELATTLDQAGAGLQEAKAVTAAWADGFAALVSPIREGRGYTEARAPRLARPAQPWWPFLSEDLTCELAHTQCNSQ
jgi:hypothetical protein